MLSVDRGAGGYNLDSLSGANPVQVYDACSRSPTSRSLCPGRDTLVYGMDYWVVFL